MAMTLGVFRRVAGKSTTLGLIQSTNMIASFLATGNKGKEHGAKKSR